MSNAFGWAEHYFVPVILPILLAMDLIILRSARKEWRERREHIKAIDENVETIKESTEQLTRRDYELTIMRGVVTAEDRILCYWHSLHPVEQSETYEEINKELAKKKEEGKDVRVVVAEDPSRIAPAYELVKQGVEVHFKESLTVSDLRFTIFDDMVSVFGVPETAVKDGKPSRHGVDISSRKLNALLAAYFDRELSQNTLTFKEFVAKHCCKVLEDPTNSVAMLADQLRVDRSVIEDACPEQIRRKKEEEEKKGENRENGKT